MGEYLQEFPPCPWWSLMVIKAVSLSLWGSVKIINEGLCLGCGNSGASFVGKMNWKRPTICSAPVQAIQPVLWAGPCLAIRIQSCAHKSSATCGLFSNVKFNVIKPGGWIVTGLHDCRFFFNITTLTMLVTNIYFLYKIVDWWEK